MLCLQTPKRAAHRLGSVGPRALAVRRLARRSAPSQTQSAGELAGQGIELALGPRGALEVVPAARLLDLRLQARRTRRR